MGRLPSLEEWLTLRRRQRPGELWFARRVVYDRGAGAFRLRLLYTGLLPLTAPKVSCKVWPHGYPEQPNEPRWIAMEPMLAALPLQKPQLLTLGVRQEDFRFLLEQLVRAVNSNHRSNTQSSPFRVEVTLTGLHGEQTVTETHRWRAADFVVGEGFAPVEYADTPQARRRFERVLMEQPFPLLPERK